MKSTQALLSENIENIERAIIALAFSSDDAIALLEQCKSSLTCGEMPSDENAELYGAAVYNALASINTAPLQTRPNRQLTDALTEAKEELRAILDYISEQKSGFPIFK